MRKSDLRCIALFIIPLYLLALLNLFWPNQQISERENRTLKQMPAISLSSVFNGRYAAEFEAFFADQFPFRPFLIQCHQRALDLLKSPLTGDIEMISRPGQDLGIGESLAHESGDHVVTPVTTGSDEASAVPTPSPAAVQPSETAAETVQPTEPEATAPSVDGEVVDFRTVIIVNDYAMELYYYNDSKAARYAELVSRLQEKVPESRVFDMVAPTSVEFHSPAKYHSNASSQKKAIASIYAKLTNGVIPVDAYDPIVRHYDEYLYFRSDHHWTARGAYYAYTAFCEAAGLKPLAMADMKNGFVPGDFLGSLYKYTNSPRLRDNPDAVEYFLPVVESQGVAYPSVSMTEGYKIRAVRTEVGSSNKYLAFIGGDNPLAHFTTTLTNGRSIVVLKESYGNAIVPFLLNHYQNVYVIDPRSLKDNLPAFIRDHQIQDVLVLNYSFSVNNASWINGFAAMIG